MVLLLSGRELLILDSEVVDKREADGFRINGSGDVFTAFVATGVTEKKTVYVDICGLLVR